MHIILLSGGSGKRLWPLSNDIRSKQFLKLFKDEYGNDESMIQRVYRQINENIENVSITVATSKIQVNIVKNQLDDNVQICVEPCRRDTYPAILLAANYLHDKLNISKNECVIVCPVDPYVESAYYKNFIDLEQNVLNGTSNLTLVGIEPTYPSDKYGYIIPSNNNKISKVKEFKEKPSADIAEKYIKEGALWNAGIFGFKLGSLLDESHKNIKYEDYDDLYNKYSDLEKISFDYAFVEKASDIDVIRYSGEWKDVGTWNTITDVISDNVIGNVQLDNFCKNTQVINELDIPLLCMGCENMIIAVSNDGIIVSTKDRCAHIKPYVENFTTK